MPVLVYEDCVCNPRSQTQTLLTSGKSFLDVVVTSVGDLAWERTAIIKEPHEGPINVEEVPEGPLQVETKRWQFIQSLQVQPHAIVFQQDVFLKPNKWFCGGHCWICTNKMSAEPTRYPDGLFGGRERESQISTTLQRRCTLWRMCCIGLCGGDANIGPSEAGHHTRHMPGATARALRS